MGCCNNDKCSAETRVKTSKRIPWFAMTAIGLVLLVLFNWQ